MQPDRQKLPPKKMIKFNFFTLVSIQTFGRTEYCLQNGCCRICQNCKLNFPAVWLHFLFLLGGEGFIFRIIVIKVLTNSTFASRMAAAEIDKTVNVIAAQR